MRYAHYKDSGIEWIGKVPQGWSVITFKRVFSDRCGGAWGEDAKHNEFDRICIRIADFDYPKMSIKKDIEYTKRNYNPDVIAKLILQKNDILIEKSGGGEQTPVGRTIIFDETFEALYANFIDRLRVRINNVPKFIQYTLNSFYQNGITYQYVKQTTGIQNLDLTNLLAKEYIALPSKVEQQQIANYLDKKCEKIDRVVEIQKSIIERLKEYKQSVITECVTGKRKVGDCHIESSFCHSECSEESQKYAQYKDSGIEWIGEIPQGWEVEKLKNLFTFGKGLSITKDNLISEGIAVISYGQIHSKFNTGTHISNDLIRFVSDSYLEEDNLQSLVNRGDFIFADTSEDIEGAGNYVFIDKEMILFAGYHSIILKNKFKNFILGRYLSYLFQAIQWRAQIRARVNGIKVYSISQKILKEITIIMPNQSDQQQIANYLDKKCAQIDKTIADKELMIEKLIEYKKSLIYECVTGKRKVV